MSLNVSADSQQAKRGGLRGAGRCGDPREARPAQQTACLSEARIAANARKNVQDAVGLAALGSGGENDLCLERSGHVTCGQLCGG